MLDGCSAVGVVVGTACIMVTLILTPGSLTVAALLSVGMAIAAPVVGPEKVPVLPAVVVKAGSLGRLVMATVDVASTPAAAPSRPVVVSGSAACRLPLSVTVACVVETGWTVGAVVAAVSVTGGESAPFCFAVVGGCIDSFTTPPSLGCGVVVAAASWLLSVTTVVSLTNVTVVNDVTRKGSLDTDVTAWLTSCAHK